MVRIFASEFVILAFSLASISQCKGKIENWGMLATVLFGQKATVETIYKLRFLISRLQREKIVFIYSKSLVS